MGRKLVRSAIDIGVNLERGWIGVPLQDNSSLFGNGGDLWALARDLHSAGWASLVFVTKESVSWSMTPFEFHFSCPCLHCLGYLPWSVVMMMSYWLWSCRVSWILWSSFSSVWWVSHRTCPKICRQLRVPVAGCRVPVVLCVILVTSCLWPFCDC